MNPATGMRVVHLIDVPDAAPVLSRWFVEAWGPWYGPNGPGDADRDLADCSSHNAIPICLVAVSPDGEVLGTATLKAESVGSELGGGPWLAAMLVSQEHQGKGVGTALVEAIETEARRLGYDSIYTSTDTAKSIMERRGWQAVGSTESLRGAITVYRRLLADVER